MERPRLFVELFAGSAAVTLQLIGGSRLRPPVAYMGNKQQFAGSILDAIGLAPGQGADAVMLCDAGPWGWAWQALAVPETCRAVAAVLRSWKDEDPTELWKRLASEPPPEEMIARAASVLWLQGKALGSVPIRWGGGRWEMPDAPTRGGGWGQAEQRTGTAATSGVGLRSTPTVAHRCEALADGVARWCALQEGNHAGKAVHVADGRWRTHGYAHLSDSARDRGFRDRLRTELVAREVVQLHAHPRPPITVHHGDVLGPFLWLCLLGDLTGVVVYLDPPYVGCTGYAADCGRLRVLAMAQALSARGATVVISEAVRLDAELGEGWYATEITAARRGQVRTFTRTKREWITMNRPPAATVAEQVPMFGGARG